MSKTNGIVITNDISSWKFFQYPVTFHLLSYIFLKAQEADGDAVVLSIRQLADQLHGVTYKELRVACNHLVADGIISIEKQNRLSLVRIRQWHALSSVVLPFKAQSGAQSLALQVADNQLAHSNKPQPKGAIKGANSGAIQNRAQSMAQSGAQSENPQLSDNQLQTSDSNKTKGAIEGAIEGANNRKVSPKKKKVSPEPPIKNKENTPSKDHTHKQKLDAAFFEKVRVAFNNLAMGTAIPTCTKMTESRKQLVRNFINDYSIEEIDTLFQIVRNSPRLCDGRSGKTIKFDVLFSEKYYVGIMEGSWSVPEPQQNKAKSLPKPAQPATQDVQSSTPTLSREERRKAFLQSWVDTERSSKSKHGQDILMAAYKSGELQKFGITWQPSVDNDLQELSTLNQLGQQIQSASKQQSASAADIIAADPNGYLAKIINKNV